MTDAERCGALSAMSWDLAQRGELVAAKAAAYEAIDEGAASRAEAILQAYQGAATFATQLGDLDEALALYEQAIHVVADLPAADYSLAAVHAVRSMSYSVHGRFDEARHDADSALAIARRTRNPSVQGLALQALGWSSWANEPDVAREAYEEAVALMTAGAIEGGLDASRGRLAPLRFAAGDAAGAVDLLLETFVHTREIGERQSVIPVCDGGLVVLTALEEDRPAAVLAGVLRAGTFGVAWFVGPERERHEAALQTLRGRLGDDGLQASLDVGAAMDAEAAMTYAIAELTRIRANMPSV